MDMTDWDRFALYEYGILASAEEEDSEDDDVSVSEEEDGLSPLLSEVVEESSGSSSGENSGEFVEVFYMACNLEDLEAMDWGVFNVDTLWR